MQVQGVQCTLHQPIINIRSTMLLAIIMTIIYDNYHYYDCINVHAYVAITLYYFVQLQDM